MCPGCYKPDYDTYCSTCRQQLFDGKKVSHILSFDAPQDENLAAYQEHTKSLSISGVQLKYSLNLEGNELVFAEKGGQYILKPIPPFVQIAEAAAAPENEHLTMQIAKQLFNIDTASNALIYFRDGSPAYITRRFDVKADGTKHQQEDMAQISGRSRQTTGENFKYEGTYEEIGNLISKYVPAYMPALENYFKIIVFNYLFSNGDAHLKNFSLIQGSTGEYLLSKAYDLMSTVLHTPNESDTAMELFKGDMDTEFYAIFGCYGQPHFRELGLRLGLVPKRITQILTRMLMSTEEVFSMIDDSFLQEKVKAKYKEAYLKKLWLMGMTKTMIAYSVNFRSVIARLSFLRGPAITGEFQITSNLSALESNNKFLFVESCNLEEYQKTKNPDLLITVDGDMLANVEVV
jgi:serine/threonine-protein kinase HipA